MSFGVGKKIKIDTELVAELIRKSRIEQKRSVEDVANSLGILPKYIQCIESGSFDKLPKGVYATSFLKKYIDFLGLGENRIVKDFLKTYKQKIHSSDLFVKRASSKIYFLSVPKIFKVFLIVLVVFVFLAYLLHYLHKINSLPELVVFEPKNNLLLDKYEVEVRGQTEANVFLTINDRNVLSDKNGFFKKTVKLKNGLNSIVVKAKKKYSKENIVVRKVFVDLNRPEINF